MSRKVWKFKHEIFQTKLLAFIITSVQIVGLVVITTIQLKFRTFDLGSDGCYEFATYS